MNVFIIPGRLIVSLGFIGLSILCILSEDFIVGRPPAWPPNINLNPLLAYTTAALLLICAAMILSKKNGGLASLIIVSMIFILSLTRHLLHFVDWLNALKTLALVGGMLIVGVSFFREDNRLTTSTRVSASARRILLWSGRIFLAAFFIAAGYAHHMFADFVVNFIPSYIPFRFFWTYFTALCLVAGGIGILISNTRKWASLLSGVMVFGWFLLLHIPRVLANINDPGERLGLFESLAISGMFFVLTGLSKGKD
ncbi:hypothetical protein [Pseudochryseolinea flava]|uniref:DoxX family protein n=1 Tax=Pseudochryseolinea flava TaxID=2059302 RepID=A0A364Y2D7_9BACT|nr:hypothetical protein [Pseudochryseolinea flava]RAW00842.1 hypothetical protein DQQ10_11390 [Pseudochryseolinea flava]